MSSSFMYRISDETLNFILVSGRSSSLLGGPTSSSAITLACAKSTLTGGRGLYLVCVPTCPVCVDTLISKYLGGRQKVRTAQVGHSGKVAGARPAR